MRKHIAKALQSRSQAIRTALERYNSAARALPVPRRQLEWKEVVEYAFLADFDLLRDARQDITHRPWATPAGRLAMGQYFKIERAREEIERLNVEVRRVATFIRDEEHYLQHMASELELTTPELAHQIHLYGNIHGQFNNHHRICLRQIAHLPGFSGSILPGICVEDGQGEAASVWAMQDASEAGRSSSDTAGAGDDGLEQVPEDQQEADDEAEAEHAEEELARSITSVLTLTAD